VPVEINDVLRQFDEAEYQQFFQVFLGVMGGISFVGGSIIVLSLIQKPKPFLYLGQSASFEEAMFAVERKTETYLEKDRLIRLTLQTGKIEESRNVGEIEKEKKRLLFWHDLSSKEQLKITQKPHRSIIRYQELSRGRKRQFTVVVLFDQIGNIDSYRVSISSRMAGNQNMESYVGYYLRDVNLSQRFPLPKAIQDKLIY
jgi:hypothetical protein